MPESSTLTTNACEKCGKLQAELQMPLKSCAKCRSVKYCSRDCQKAHWTKHRKFCAGLANQRATKGIPGSLDNPPKSEIEKHATQTIELMEALTTLPGFSRTDAASTTPLVLRHTFGFLVTTFNEYWGPLLQPLLSVKLATRIPLGTETEGKEERMLAQFDELERKSEGGFDRHQWPEFDREKYTDALGRNTMACLIVTDDRKRRELFKGMEPEGWGFGDEIKSVARGMMQDPPGEA